MTVERIETSGAMTEEALSSGVRGDLRGRLWKRPELQPVGGLVIVHGLGEHGQRYRSLAENLTAAGWGVVAVDLPGHGLSPGRRGHIASYDQTLREVGAMLDSAAANCPELPLVLLGHSMGGNLAANYALRRQEIAPESARPVGLVLSGPMFLPQKPPPRPQIFAAWLTGRLLPWWTIRAPISGDRLTHNQSVIEEIREDPLVHNRLSLYLGTQLLAQGRHALDHAAALDLPTLLLHGEDDPITSYRASESFALRAGERAEFVGFPGLLHEVFHEPERDHVVAKLLDWLTRFEAVR